MKKVRDLLEFCLECDPVLEIVGVLRMRARGPSPGVVKATFTTVENKVAVLRCKQKLKSNNWFKMVHSSSILFRFLSLTLKHFFRRYEPERTSISSVVAV